MPKANPGKEKELEVKTEIRKEIKKHKFLDNYETLQAELKQGYRVVMYKDKEYYIYNPSVKDEEIVAQARAKFAGILMKDPNILTNSEIMTNLENRGIWRKAEIDKETKFNEYITDEMSRMFAEYVKDEPNEDVIYKHKVEKERLEKEKSQFSVHKNLMMSYSFENLLDAFVNKMKLALCVKSADGSKVWSSVEDLENEKDTGLVIILSNQALYYWFGWHPDML